LNNSFEPKSILFIRNIPQLSDILNLVLVLVSMLYAYWVEVLLYNIFL
jgi:hypothetical protein